MSYAAMLWIFGWIVAAFAAAMTLPALIGIGFGESALALAFLAAAGVTGFAGVTLIVVARGARSRDLRREGFVLAVLTWGALPAFGALPFALGGVTVGVTEPYFEAMSGLTTTGATIFGDPESLGRSVLFWRGLMQWFGGLATIVLAIVVLAPSGAGGARFHRLTSPRGEHDSLAGQIIHAARAVWWIYGALTIACGALLWVTGVPAFDALCLALSTVSTGGFATTGGSIAAFDNMLAESVLVVFMLAGAVSFSAHLMIAYGRRRAYLESPEVRTLAAVCIAAAVIFVLVLVLDLGTTLGEGLRIGIFSVVSLATTTGFSNAESVAWPAALPVLAIALVLIGGSSGSTAGGLKLMRLEILLKEAAKELRRLAHPHGIVRVRYGGHALDEDTKRAAWSFFIVYVFCFVALALALAALGLDFRAAVTATAAALANTGPGLELMAGFGVGGYDELPGAAKWILGLAMLIGRLELFGALVLLRPGFWRS